MRHPDILNRYQTILLVVDVQEKLLPAIHEGQAVVDNIRRLVKGAALLDMPVVVSEQYPQGLGRTVKPIAEELGRTARYEKVTFSCLGDSLLAEVLGKSKRKCLLICGMETHVCVAQSALDALALGFKVQVAADAVSSRTAENKRLALERLAAAGAVITSTEAALFELMERSGTEEFKKFLSLVK